MRSRKKRGLKANLILILLVMSLGYALLNSNLKIGGIATILGSKWDIHWNSESIKVTKGSVEGEPPEVNEAMDEVTYTANLNTPGEYYEFTIDAKNYGTVDGAISKITTKFYEEDGVTEYKLPYYLESTITYEDDTELSEDQVLKKGESKTYKVRFEYKRNINNEDLDKVPESIIAKVEVEDEPGKGNSDAENNIYVRELCDNTKTYTNNTEYLVEKVEDLVCLSKVVSEGTNFNTSTVKMTKDIDFNTRNNYIKSKDTTYGDINGNGEEETLIEELTTGKGFKPIGNDSKMFQGTFNGNNKTISNLYINRPDEDYVGLFGYITGTINGINFNSSNVTGKGYTGTVAGFISLSTKNSVLDNSIINDVKVTGSGNYVGGLFGYTTNIKIQKKFDDFKNIKVMGTGTHVGGLVGRIDSGNIETMELADTIEVQGKEYVGGIVGEFNSSSINEVIISTKVTSNTSKLGGIFSNGSSSSVKNSIISTETRIGNDISGPATGYYGSSVGGSFILKQGSTGLLGISTAGYTGPTIYYFDEMSGSLSGGWSTFVNFKEEDINISALSAVLDTKIGGDSDGTGYYFDVNEDKEIHLVSVSDNPIEFTLSGSGTEEDPYLIHNPKEWNEATTKAQQVGVYFKIANDIDFTGKEFYKMGGPNSKFNGTLDGNNHILTGIKLIGGGYTGVFGYTTSSALVKNLKISNSEIENGKLYVGMISGYNDGMTLDDVTMSGITISGTGNYVGGLYGYTSNNITKQINTISNLKVQGKDYVGGLVGYTLGNIETIELNDEIEVEATGNYVGGLVGYGSVVNEVKVKTKVTGYNYVGGIIGNTGQNTIKNILLETTVVGTYNSSSACVGGIVGDSYRATLDGSIIEKGSSNQKSFVGYTGGNGTRVTSKNYYLPDYTATTPQGTQWPSSHKNDLEKYSQAIETPLTGDTDGSGYYFDYILGDSSIHLVEVKDYTGWKLMNNLTPLENQRWSYYDDNHQRIESGWHYLKDTYGEDKWYYFENYYKKIGWHEEDGKKYFLSNIDDDGNGYLNGNRFENRTETIDGVEYTFDENGVCTNCS